MLPAQNGRAFPPLSRSVKDYTRCRDAESLQQKCMPGLMFSFPFLIFIEGLDLTDTSAAFSLFLKVVNDPALCCLWGAAIYWPEIVLLRSGPESSSTGHINFSRLSVLAVYQVHLLGA